MTHVDTQGLRLSPWYLNTRRLAAMSGVTIDVAAESSLNNNSGERATAMRKAALVAQSILTSGRIPNLTKELITNGLPHSQIDASIWGVFTFRGVSNALMREHDGKKYERATFRGEIPIGPDVIQVSGSLSNDHIYSTSSPEYLSNKRRALILGQFDFSTKPASIRPFIIGDFVTDVSDLPYLGEPNRWRIYPAQIDAFAKIRDQRSPPVATLKKLLEIPEAAVKSTFAEILGEPFVPKDWGGEKSDLSTNQLTVDGRTYSAAFMFKGPSVPGELHPANLGKRGDQLVRAFEEPVELVAIQHCNKIANTVVRQAEAFAADPAKPRKYCIIDGADTYRILKSYGKLGL